MIHSCIFLFSDSCSWVTYTDTLFAVLQKNPQILWFSSIFVYLNPFQQWQYDFEIHLFSPRTTEGLIYNYYKLYFNKYKYIY